MIPNFKLHRSAEKAVQVLSKVEKSYWESSRYQILKEFTKSGGKILSVGSGPKEPLIIHATHALDLTPLSETFLRKAGWKGSFFCGTCTSLPFEDKSFDIVVCSEVIEHLPSIEDVIKTFKEVSRVGKRWIITTPNSDVQDPKKQSPYHILFFTVNKLKEIIPVPFEIYTNDYHIYVENYKAR